MHGSDSYFLVRDDDTSCFQWKSNRRENLKARRMNHVQFIQSR